jgi:hypothetical protein
MEARDRFISAIAKSVNEAYYSQGEIFIDVTKLEALADEVGLSHKEARAVLRLLDDRGLLYVQEGGRSYSDGLGIALRYEEAARAVFWEHNQLRRRILELARAADDSGEGALTFQEGKQEFVEAPWAEAFAASRTLEYMGLLEVDAAMGHNFWARITPEGYEVVRDQRELDRTLPTSAAEDDEAAATVAADALRDVITSTEALIEARGWSGTARELARGDDQYRDGHWKDAVGEYYSALESALKHRLDEADVEYAEKASLRDLARHAATNGLIPRNYQELFSFINSIRSPRSHGAGGTVEEIEIGQAEALLMGNHVRSLILYLGHRPS